MKVLVIRSGALGDTILTFPLLDSIGKAYPHVTRTLLGSRAYLDLVHPAIHCFAIDATYQTWLFSANDKGIPHKDFCFDAAYVILNRPHQVVHNLLKSGARNVCHVSPTPMPGIHLVEHLHAGIDMPVPERRHSLPHLAAGEKKNLIWIHPGSGSPQKCIPLDVWVSLSRKLLVDTGWDVLVTATEQDAFLMNCPEWKSLVGHPRVHLLVNKSLRSLCQELGGAQLFMGNDSGISHLAAGLGIKSLVFFLASDPINWAPWAPKNQVSVVDCRFGLLAQSVVQHQAYELLNGGRELQQ
jgi:heptosyltransferase III